MHKLILLGRIASAVSFAEENGGGDCYTRKISILCFAVFLDDLNGHSNGVFLRSMTMRG
jgi:hypothetical protein